MVLHVGQRRAPEEQHEQEPLPGEVRRVDEAQEERSRHGLPVPRVNRGDGLSRAGRPAHAVSLPRTRATACHAVTRVDRFLKSAMHGLMNLLDTGH